MKKHYNSWILSLLVWLRILADEEASDYYTKVDDELRKRGL